MKKVLDVGQCGTDHFAIRRLIERQFKAEVVQAHDAAEALAQLRGGPFDLVLVNRKLDLDHSDGLEIIRTIKSDPDLAATTVMLVSNYPDCQAQAVTAGAARGFGKSELTAPSTRELLQGYLG
jgi:CheY-like chemotaxis protein